MQYKTELHCHTGEISCCAHLDSKSIVDKYVEFGYHTLVVTNHLSPTTFFDKRSNYTGTDNWNEMIDFYLSGVETVRQYAKGRLNVLWGLELLACKDKNDYLIYGMTEQQLREYTDILEISVRDFSPRLRQMGLLVYQAHPFRNAIRVVDPQYLDGIEVYNGHRKHDSRNDFAKLWADRFSYRRISGTDLHDADHVPTGGILTDVEITSNAQLADILAGNDYTLLHEGEDPRKVIAALGIE